MQSQTTAVEAQATQKALIESPTKILILETCLTTLKIVEHNKEETSRQQRMGLYQDRAPLFDSVPTYLTDHGGSLKPIFAGYCVHTLSAIVIALMQ